MMIIVSFVISVIIALFVSSFFWLTTILLLSAITITFIISCSIVNEELDKEIMNCICVYDNPKTRHLVSRIYEKIYTVRLFVHLLKLTIFHEVVIYNSSNFNRLELFVSIFFKRANKNVIR